MKYQILNEDLVEEIATSSDPSSWIVLAPHPEFPSHWLAQSLNNACFFDFKDILGSYKTLSPTKLEDFLELAKSLDYKVAFEEDPQSILDHFETLNTRPGFSLNSSLEDTVCGLLPHQLQGFNFLKDLEGGVALWGTGAGKTALAIALLKHHLEEGFDTAFVVVKSHNKVNTARMLKRLGDLDSVVIDGTRAKRESMYTDLFSKKNQIVILNYEKFRVDDHSLQLLFKNRDVVVLWDEMPTKLKNRSTALYKRTRQCLYSSIAPRSDKRKPKRLRQWMLSATPIENSPEDFYNCVRLLDPNVYGSIDDFRDSFVSSYSAFDPGKPDTWHSLERMGLMAAHITHKVDKEDPDIAKYFPKTIEEPYYIDWSGHDRKLYDRLTKKAKKKLDDDEDVESIFAVLAVLQMLCDAPSMIQNSGTLRLAYEEALLEWLDEGGREPDIKGSSLALKLIQEMPSEQFVDDHHTKIDTLKSLLLEVHPNSKVVVFSAFNEALLPILGRHFEEWGVSYVTYNGTDKQKQKAQDAFTDDPNIRVFLSSDKGSDSINLEAADVVIHYDLPWKWSTLIQRQNRIHRVTSKFDTVRFYTLLMANSIEDRKMEVISRKLGYHDAVFNGVISEQSTAARMTKEDLRYILGV